MQNSSFQRHGLRWWDLRGSHHPRLGKTLGCQRKGLRRRETKETVTDLQQLFQPMGDLLGTRCWKRCWLSRKRLVLTVPAQTWVSEMHTESHWAEQEQEPSGVCGHTTPPVRVALPAVRIKERHHGQLPHHGGKCLINDSGYTYHCFPKYTSLCSYQKFHLGFHIINFQCFMNRNYSRVFQVLERSITFCIPLWLRLGNNLTDLDSVNVHSLFFAPNEFILE